MKIDVGHAVYTIAMILLAFTTALVLTKTIAKYTEKKDVEEEE